MLDFPRNKKPIRRRRYGYSVERDFICRKRKTEALKIAAGFRGVINVSVEADKDQVIVIGVGIDSVCLAKSLRKKLSYAQIESVEEVKKAEEKKKPATIPIQWTHASSYVPYPMHCDVVCYCTGD